jgi:C1A family cysteine protease
LDVIAARGIQEYPRSLTVAERSEKSACAMRQRGSLVLFVVALCLPIDGVAQAPKRSGLTSQQAAANPQPQQAPSPAAAPAPPRKRRSLQDHRKIGLEKPPLFKKKPGPPRRTGMKSPLKRKLAPKVTARDAELAALRAKRYQEREAKASSALSEKLKKIRASLAKKKASFQVGATAVSEKPIKEITGLTGEPDLKAAKEQKKKKESRRGKPNLVRATMRERATPPPAAPKRGRDRRDPDDISPMADSKLIVTPDDARGTSGEWFPSSAMPSPSNPQFSWRDKLSPVRNQEICGSCWAFAALGAYEGSQSLLNDEKLDLSEQQLVNCVAPHVSTAGDNCRGNMPATALDWMTLNGSPTEQSLPYAGRMASCNSGLRTDFRAISWGFVSEDDPRLVPNVEAMKEAIAAHGPIVATVFVNDSFQSYTGGVFDDSSNARPNHAVVIAGWDDARQAWHVRNSWGTAWGEDGYIWVKYGVNSIGYLASWVDAEKVPKPAPEEKLFKDRYVSLKNAAGEDLDVFVQALVPSGSSFKWLPADPEKSQQAWKFRVSKGKVLDAKRPDSGKFLRAKSLRVWATSTDGKRSWNDFKAKTANIAKKSYKAAERGRYTQEFGKSAKTPDPDQILLDAHEAKEDSKYADAREKFALFSELFPDDDRVHEARFWTGWAENQEGRHWDAVETLFQMIAAAPDGDENLSYAFFYLGDSYSQLGYCGYAVRSFEVVALGETDAPKEWVKAAKDMIKYLNNDEGGLCDNWD